MMLERHIITTSRKLEVTSERELCTSVVGSLYLTCGDLYEYICGRYGRIVKRSVQIIIL